MAMVVDLFLIDPQNDFMGEADGSPYTVNVDGKAQSAALPVPGAVADMQRLSKLVDRVGDRLHDIHVSMDSHRVIDVSHGGLWRNAKGEAPPPFTFIKEPDILNGIWTPRNPKLRDRMLDYVRQLAANGRYDLCIWPEHCIIGSWGHNVHIDLAAALQRWERSNYANVDYITKGDNYLTEHYGALEAEVPDPTDPKTQLNSDFLEMIAKCDMIGLAGEASSHCVKETIRQIAVNIGDEHIKKFYILTDCMSPVIHPAVDFPKIAADFFADMEKRGMHLTTSAEFLA